MPPEHVCGLAGYNPMIDDMCPGCEYRYQKYQETAYEDAMDKWARAYDELNGAPENDEDR